MKAGASPLGSGLWVAPGHHTVWWPDPPLPLPPKFPWASFSTESPAPHHWAILGHPQGGRVGSTSSVCGPWGAWDVCSARQSVHTGIGM